MYMSAIKLKITKWIAFGAIVRDHRQRLDMNCSELAGKAKLALSVVSSIESGGRQAGAKVSEQLAKALGLAGDERAKFLTAALGTTVRERLPSVAVGFDAVVFEPTWKKLAALKIKPGDIKQSLGRLVIDKESQEPLRNAMLGLADRMEARAEEIRAKLGTKDGFVIADLAIELNDGQWTVMDITAASRK